MMTLCSRAVATAFASVLLIGCAFAQTAAPATPAPAATAAKKAEKARTPESMECSTEADSKGLKGKERKKFRKACIKEKKGAAAPAAK